MNLQCLLVLLQIWVVYRAVIVWASTLASLAMFAMYFLWVLGRGGGYVRVATYALYFWI